MVTVTWSGITPPTPADWIGLYVPAAADGAYRAWIYVSCSQTPGAAKAAGSCAFTLPSELAPGGYELRLYANNGYTRLATSGIFTTGSGGATLGVSPTSVTAGGMVTVTWSGITPPTPADWIGLYVPATAGGAYRAWIYVSCSQTPGAAKAAGSCAFTLPGEVAPGGYEVRLYANNGYTRLATSDSFSVTP